MLAILKAKIIVTLIMQIIIKRITILIVIQQRFSSKQLEIILQLCGYGIMWDWIAHWMKRRQPLQ
jgi:hypothetical protein